MKNENLIRITIEVPGLADLIAVAKSLVVTRFGVTANPANTLPAAANHAVSRESEQAPLSPRVVDAEASSPTEAPAATAAAQSDGAVPAATHTRDVAPPKQAEITPPVVVAAHPPPAGAPAAGLTATDGPATQLSYPKDVAPTMMKLLTEKGSSTVAALLARYGVKRGGDLPADKLAKALAEAEALLNG